MEIINIREVSKSEFHTLYRYSENRLANHYVENLADKDGILSAFCENGPVGYIIYRVGGSCGSETFALNYLFVSEQYRNRGIAAKLLAAAEEVCKTGKYNCIKLCLSEGIKGVDYLYSFFIRNNYTVKGKYHVFRCERDDFCHWEQYLERRGDRLINWLMNVQEYSVLFLDCLDENILRTLRDSSTPDHQSNLQILSLLENDNIRLVKSMSCIAVKDSVPVAYCLVTSPDDISVVFERIYVSERHRNAGVILLPFAMSMKKFNELGYQRAAYIMKEDNASALAFAQRVLSPVTRHRKMQYNLEKAIALE